MRCVVTGGCGFIGRHLSGALAAEGHSVLAIDLEDRPLPDRVALWVGDLRSAAALNHMAKADVIYHLAAMRSVQRSIEDPGTTVTWNVECMLAVLKAARPGARVVTASSSSVYGPNPEGRASEETDPLFPCSPYAASKAACESLCESWFRSYGASIVSLRYFNVYGPGQDPNGAYAAVIPRFLTAAVEEKTATIYGGEQSRSFTYVGDVVRATQLAGSVHPLGASASRGRDAAHEILNVGGLEATSIAALAGLVRKVTGAPLDVRYESARSGESRVTRASLDRVSQILDWEPRVSLAAGLRMTWDSMRTSRRLIQSASTPGWPAQPLAVS